MCGPGPVYLLLPLSFPHSIPALAAHRTNPLIASRCQLALTQIWTFSPFFTFSLSGKFDHPLTFCHVHFTLFHQQAMTDYEVIDVQHIYHLLITQWINISINRYLTYHRWDPTDQSCNNRGEGVGRWLWGKLGEKSQKHVSSSKYLFSTRYSNYF